MKTCDTNLASIRHLSIFVLLCVIVLLSISMPSFAKGKPYPGKLIDIGTHRLHINCVGNGAPTVIIDSGIGGFSLEWLKIQYKLAKNVRVCSYDRAGYGWSDPGPRPRTTERITYELHHLLNESKIPGPYLLVGHSFGGYNIRYFASKYPEATAGLILIDASHPEQFNTEEFKRVKQKQEDETHYKNSYKVRVIHSIISDSYPPENKQVAMRLMSSMKSRSTVLNEMDNMEMSARQVARQTNHPPYIFPVTILTRGKRVWAHDELGERREQQWLRLQNDLEMISMQSKHLLAKESGHIIHLDEPEFVIHNILSTVLRIRNQYYGRNSSRRINIHSPHLLSNTPFDQLSYTHFEQFVPQLNDAISDNPIRRQVFHPNFRTFSTNSITNLP